MIRVMFAGFLRRTPNKYRELSELGAVGKSLCQGEKAQGNVICFR